MVLWLAWRSVTLEWFKKWTRLSEQASLAQWLVWARVVVMIRSQPGGVANARRSPLYCISEICGYIKWTPITEERSLKATKGKEWSHTESFRPSYWCCNNCCYTRMNSRKVNRIQLRSTMAHAHRQTHTPDTAVMLSMKQHQQKSNKKHA